MNLWCCFWVDKFFTQKYVNEFHTFTDLTEISDNLALGGWRSNLRLNKSTFLFGFHGVLNSKRKYPVRYETDGASFLDPPGCKHDSV